MSAWKGILFHPVTVRCAQVVTGVLVGWASLAKLGDLGAFAQQVHNFRILPIAAEHLVAMTLPWIELVAALSLVLGVRRRSGGIVAATLLSVFTLGVIAAVARGLDFECGCFGTSDASRVGWTKVLQNLAMVAIALIASAEPRRPVGEEGPDPLAAGRAMRAGGA